MDKVWNFSNLCKVNGNCCFKGSFFGGGLIYEVEFTLCDAMCIGKTQKTFNERKDGYFSNICSKNRVIRIRPVWEPHGNIDLSQKNSKVSRPCGGHSQEFEE